MDNPPRNIHLVTGAKHGGERLFPAPPAPASG